MKFTSTIIRRGNGSVGNMTVTKWKDKLVMKQKAETVANPQTDAQMIQRSKFAILVAVSKAIPLFVRIGFKEVSLSMTEFNKFVSVNSGNDYLTWNSTQWEADPSKLEISKGSLETAAISFGSFSNGATSITVSFPTSAVGNQSTGDKLYCFISANGKSGKSIGTVSRSAGSASLTMSSALATSDEVHVYAYFVSADGTKVSDTVYAFDTV